LICGDSFLMGGFEFNGADDDSERSRILLHGYYLE